MLRLIPRPSHPSICSVASNKWWNYDIASVEVTDVNVHQVDRRGEGAQLQECI